MEVRLFKPSVGQEELDKIKETFTRAWLGLGSNVSEFEQKWSSFIGCKESVGVNSCTAALHLAVSAFRFPAGKKVLVPVNTFASTAMAALYNNLQPVFVDIDEKTGGMSLEDLDRKYDKDCVAVLPVHYFGHPVPMDQLVAWTKSRNLKVIEDSAHSAGGKFKGKSLGTWGDIGCFSFEEKKCMTTGDGGMICSDDAELLKPLRQTRLLGMNKDVWTRTQESNSNIRNANNWYYTISLTGYKYNMNDVAAAMGLVQLEKLEKMNRKREEILQKYLNGIQNCNYVKTGLPYDLENSSYWAFLVRVKDREAFIPYMADKGISTGVHFMPLTLHPLFQKYKTDTPIADQVWKEYVTLPLYPDLTDDEIDYVIDTILAYKE